MVNNTPWSYEFIGHDTQEWWIYDSLGFIVATTMDEANARLIAAAPELLEALQDGFPYIGAYHENLASIVGDAYDKNNELPEGFLEKLGFFDNLDKSRELHSKAQAAITKATGDNHA